MTTNQAISVGVVGCGRASDYHFDAYDECGERFEVVGVCDPDRARRRRAAERTGAAAFETLEELLDAGAPDLVALATPNGLHPEQAIRASAAGAHVVSEKPLATRWEDGVRAVRACREAGRRLFVVHQLRYNPTLQLLRETIQSGRFGSIHFVDIDIFWTRPQSYYDEAGWRGTRELDGGAFANQCSHYVDLLRWLFGDPASVRARTATLAREIEVEDTGTLTVEWEAGGLGSMSVTVLTYPENYEASVTVVGERGTVRLGGAACDTIEHWTFEDEQPVDDRIAEVNRETRRFYGSGHAVFYENVYEVLRRGAEPDSDAEDGLDSLELIAAAYRSADRGRRVELPLERDATPADGRT